MRGQSLFPFIVDNLCCLGGEDSSGSSQGLQALARGSAIVKRKLKLQSKNVGRSRKEMVC